jgi:hypothetical protein
MLRATLGPIPFVGNPDALRWKPPSQDHFAPDGPRSQIPPSGPQARISAGLCREKSMPPRFLATATSLGQNKPFRAPLAVAGPARWQAEWGPRNHPKTLVCPRSIDLRFGIPSVKWNEPHAHQRAAQPSVVRLPTKNRLRVGNFPTDS